jgi:branched-chain amino acid transport system ATP-binding protein
MAPLLEVRSLRAGYGRIPILHGVDLDAGAGRVTVLVGPNGAGKTTLLRAVTGLARTHGGGVTLAGTALTGASPPRVVAAGIGFVPAGRQLFRSQTVESNLDLGMYSVSLGRSERAERVEQVYELFPILGEFRSRTAGLLSGGQQQMLAIGQVLVRRPKLLLLDEPSLGLAPAIILELFAAVRRLCDAGTSILLVEQAVDAALELGDDGYVLSAGQVAASGPCDELRDSPALLEAFLGTGHHSTPPR